MLAYIKNYRQVEKAIKKNKYVFNFAGVSDIDEANQFPLKTINYNIIGKEKMTVRKIINLISKKTFAKKIIYRQNKYNDVHYKVNPFTYRVREGRFLKVKKGIKLAKGIQEIIDDYSNNAGLIIKKINNKKN